jgi:DNA-binding beta-propeller fold protein YncE
VCAGVVTSYNIDTSNIGRIVASSDSKYLYVTFIYSNTIQRINLQTKEITIVASLDRPEGLIMDQQNNLLICDRSNHRIVKINTNTGNIKYN